MKFKIISSLALAAVSLAAFAFLSTAYGFAESFVTTCVVMMLPLAFEPLGRVNPLFVKTGGIPQIETAQPGPAIRKSYGHGPRIPAIRRQAA